MATTKKTETKTTEKKTATAKKAEPAAKKEPVKKAPAKKAAATKKTTTAKKATATKVEVFIEFGGAQVSIDEVIKNVKLVNGQPAKEIAIYIKPEESKAYFVADGEDKEMDVFFC